MGTRRDEWQGQNWIRPARRLAIYLRDGLACVYCEDAIEDGAILTLDHLKPCVRNGSNESTNLVTACKRCNSARGARAVRTFCRSVAEYLDRDWQAIERRVRNASKRQVDVKGAKAIIARRGTCKAAMEAMVKVK